MALTRIKISSIVAPAANAGTVLTVQSNGVVTANTVTTAGGANNARTTAYSLVFGG